MSGSAPIRTAEPSAPVPPPRYDPAADRTELTPIVPPAADLPAEQHPDLLDLLLAPRSASEDDAGPAALPLPGAPPPAINPHSPWSRPGPFRTNAVWFWLLGPLLVAVVLVAFLGGMVSAPVVLPAPAEARPASILDVQGRAVATVEPPTSSEQLPDNELPDLLLQAVVAVQDPDYFSRRGLPAADLLAASAADLVRVRRRGRTIEERYARQVRVAAGSTAPSLRESSVAVRLSQRLSRRALLCRYVNGMYFGNGVYGVGAAARFYFGAPVTALNPAQIAMLSGIADDPSARNPLTAPAAAAAAEHDALAAMRRIGLLSAEQADALAAAPVVARAHPQLERPSAAPDFTALVESSLLSRFGDDVVYGQGLQVTTPLDLDLQAALDDNARRLVPAGSTTVLALATDPRSGDIRALLARGTPGGAADVLFRERPLGTLTTTLPTPISDGPTASLGAVATAAGAVAADGVRHDLRPVTSVRRPAGAGWSAETLDSVDPLPSGQRVLGSDQAAAQTLDLRAVAQQPGPADTQLPFALAGLSGSAGPDTWYVGCVPELCLTVWIGPQGPATRAPTPALARSLVTATFSQYLNAAPGRIAVPTLPAPRADPAQAAAPLLLPRSPPPAAVSPSPSASASPSAQPSDSARPPDRPSAPPAQPTLRPPASLGPGPGSGPGPGTTGNGGGP